MRSAIRDWFSGSSSHEACVDDVILVATELFANAVRASAKRADIEMHLRAEADHVVIAITNSGAGFDLAAIPPPDPRTPGGRGLAIAQAVGDVSVIHGEGRTTVRVRCPTTPANV